jgi:tripartite ATP-independent transporter DctM subunit
MLLLVMFLSLAFMFCLNVPIAIALAISAMIGIVATDGLGALVNTGLDMYHGATNFPLIAVPMFVLAGAIMNATGITKRLIAFVSELIGFVHGGLAMVTVGVSLFVAEISGSAVADVAAIGSVLIPEMKRRGYPPPFAAAVSSSSASLAIIIPPSIPMILYAVSANTSVEELFVAGFIPGLIGGAGLLFVAYILARRYSLPVEEAFSFRRVRRTFVEAAPTFLIPVIILGGIFGGLVTATEAAGLAVLASILVGLFYREVDFKDLKSAMLDGGIQTAVVMLLVASSVLMSNYLTTARVPQEIAAWMLGLTQNKYLILLFLNILFLILGCFLHSSAAIILVVPIVLPLIKATGIDPVHFGLVLTINLAIGQQTPPVASVLITACSIAKTDIWETTKVNVYFVAVLFAVLLLSTYVPAVPMFSWTRFIAKQISQSSSRKPLAGYPGSEKMQALQFVQIPDKTSPFRDDGPLAWKAASGICPSPGSCCLGEISHSGLNAAFRVGDAGKLKAHLHSGKRAEDRQIVRVSEMADAEDLAGEFAQPGPERHVEAFENERAHLIGVVSFGRAHPRYSRRVMSRVRALQLQPPGGDSAPASFAMPDVPGENGLHALLMQHGDRFFQAVEQRGCGSIRKEAAFVIRQHLLPVPIAMRQPGGLSGFERFLAHRSKGESGRKHQSFLRTGDRYIDSPVVVAIVDGGQRGDGVDHQESGMIGCVQRAPDVSDGRHASGRGFAMNNAYRFDGVVAILAQPRFDGRSVHAPPPIRWKKFRMEADALRQAPP